MISLADYLDGRNTQYPEEYTDAVKGNALVTVARANLLLRAFGRDRGVRSGWRPLEVNAKTPHASVHSNHIIGAAIDIEDNDTQLGQWCLQNLGVLEDIGLWLENPKFTWNWVHVQICAPRSGRRVFDP